MYVSKWNNVGMDSEQRERGFVMKEKILAALSAAFALVFASPQSIEVVTAKQVVVYDAGTVTEQGYVLAQVLQLPPEWGGGVFNYVAFDPNTIKIADYRGEKVISLTLYKLKIRNFKVEDTYQCDIDLHDNLYWTEGNDEWNDLTEQRAFIWDDDHSCTVTDAEALRYIVEYVKENRPEIHQEIMNGIKEKEEKEVSAERERLSTQLDTAYRYAENDVARFAQYGKQIDWAEFTQDSVDYAKSPALSDLIGHVFQLTDTYGFQTQRGDNGTPVIKTDRRKSALVHFTILQNPNGTYQIALMDDTGDFVGRDNVNRMPLMTDFRAYHEEFGYYTGLNDVFHKTGSFHSMGEVIGFPNLSNGLVSDGFVKVGLEKTDEVGKYRLVYYVTKESYDSYGGRSKASTKHDGYYATLTLVK